MTLSSTQRTILAVLIGISLLSLTAAAWGVAKLGFARSNTRTSSTRITVTDSAQVKASPDTAFVTFGVVNRDRKAENAAGANAAKTAAVIDAIRKAGIPKSDIETVDFRLEPAMNYEKSPAVLVGYDASNSVRVRTKDIQGVGDLIDAAISAGANNVRGVRFDVEDKRKLRQRALALAVGKAEEKGEAIAGALGAELGPAVSASESVDMNVPESRNYVMQRVARYKARTPISPGEATVSAQVKVVYSVR